MKVKMFALFISLVFSGIGVGQTAIGEIDDKPSISFKVVSMRFMDKAEGLKRGGLAETDVAIRVRLETKKYVEFLSVSKNSISPVGFVIERKNGANVWRAGSVKGETPTSPGSEALA